MKKPKKLSDVLEVLFQESTRTGSRTGETELVLSHFSKAWQKGMTEAVINGEPLTMVLVKSRSKSGGVRTSSLQVYAMPLNEYRPDKVRSTKARITIEQNIADPDKHTTFKTGKGFWISERLTVDYNDETTGGPMSVFNSQGSSNEFLFYLKLQTRAYELATMVKTHGHWQAEWNPNGDYSTPVSARKS